MLFCGNVLSVDSQKANDLLREAVLSDSVEGLKSAIELGADIYQGIDGYPAILWVVLWNKINIAEELLNYDIDKNMVYAGKNLAQNAARLGHLELSCLLIQDGISCEGYEEKIKSFLYCFLQNAILHDSPEEIKRVVKLGADIHSLKHCCREPIWMALRHRKPKAFVELIKQGVDINAEYANPFLKGSNKKTLLYLCLDLLASPLFPEAFEYALQLVKLGARLEFNRGNYSNWFNSDHTVFSTFLWRSNSFPKEKIFEFINELTKQGYDINSEDNVYNNSLVVLFYSFYSIDSIKFLALLEFFLKKGADVNKTIDLSLFRKDKNLRWIFNPLHEAITKNLSKKQQTLDVIKFLLDNRAKVNQKARPFKGNLVDLNSDTDITPLFYAYVIGSKTGDNDIANLLLSYGAKL